MSEEPSLIGQVLGGRLKIVRSLGEGGMGTVYEAVHTIIGSRAAVKLLHPKYSQNADAIRRFYREARAAAAIGHPSIVGVHDVGVTPAGAHFLVMEILPGESLAQRLEYDRRLPVAYMCYLACQVLSGLAAAHGKGIVHRDLKPENIYLVETGTPLPGVKILDFGISRIVGAAVAQEGFTRITQTGIVIGTPEYMSPEHAAGKKDVDHRTDLYALGVILYECLTGVAPFEGANPAHVLSLIHSADPVRPRKLAPDLPEKLEAVVLRAMAKNRELRFQSAWEMFNALIPYVSEQALASVPLPEKPKGGLPVMVDDDAATNVVGQQGGMEEATAAGGSLGVDGPTEVDPEAQAAVPAPDAAPAGPPSAAAARSGVPGRAVYVGAAIAVLILGLGAGGIYAYAPYVMGNADDEGDPSVPRARQLDAGAMAVTAGGRAADADEAVREAAAAPEVPPEPLSADVFVRLEPLPLGAKVYLDGRAVSQLPLKLPRGSTPHSIRVVKGDAEFLEEFAPEQDLTLEVKLAPRRRGPRDGGVGQEGDPISGGNKVPYTPGFLE